MSANPSWMHISVCLMTKFSLPSCPTWAEPSARISMMKNVWTEWAMTHLSKEWCGIWFFLANVQCVAKAWGNISKWRQHAKVCVVPRGQNEKENSRVGRSSLEILRHEFGCKSLGATNSRTYTSTRKVYQTEACSVNRDVLCNCNCNLVASK